MKQFLHKRIDNCTAIDIAITMILMVGIVYVATTGLWHLSGHPQLHL